MNAQVVDSRVEALLPRARRELSMLLAQLRELVAIESPSHDKIACDRALALAADWARELGASVHFHRSRTFADSLEARFFVTRGAGARKPLLLLGHLDTVWPEGTLWTMPFRVTRDRVSGPGVLDMKAGVAMAFAALRIVRDAGDETQPVTLLLHGDEEVGSPASRAVTERVASRCEAVYVLEPAQGPGGAYKTARKGVGHYRLEVQGVAAHSGVDFLAGQSAVLELGHQLGALAALTDLKRGLTVNPGVIGGGTLSNVVAAEAWAEIDVRIPRAADARRIERQLRGLKARNPVCRLVLTGGINRPPMERTAAIAALFQQAQGHARLLGIALEEAATGGGSDGNFTAALGIPTLDGMGAVGAGAHASHEHIVRGELAARTALLAANVPAVIVLKGARIKARSKALAFPVEPGA